MTQGNFKRSGLVSRPSPTYVPDNVSGRDVSAAAARMPRLDFSRPADGGTALPPTGPAPASFPVAAAPLPDANGIVRLRVELLDDSPFQPRLRYDETKLGELAESLRLRQIDPVTVRRKADGRYEVISGHRRRRAAPLAQLEELDCRIIDVGDEEARLLVLAANEPHEEFTDFERALAYRAALDAGQQPGGGIRSMRQLADKVGVSVSLVHRRLSMLELPDVIKDVLRDHPAAFSSNWVAKLRDLVAKPYDAEKLRTELVRVATGDLPMTALFSVMATATAAPAQTQPPQRGLSLQRGNRLFAQITPNAEKRQVVVKLPGDCNITEVAEIILAAIDQRFTANK